MRKYVLTDRAGITATGQTLAPGKFIQATRDKSNIMPRINECGAETSLLAALISPIPADQARLFSIHCWNVTIDPKNAQSYTVVKEVDRVPVVTAEQRLRFAVLVAKETFRDKQFRHWADRWLSGTDCTATSARELISVLEKELQAAAELEAIGAWSETGADTEKHRQQDDGAKRAGHVLHAVELLENPERAASAAMEIAQSLSGLDRLATTLPLTTMSELAVSETQLQQATG